MRIKLIHLIVFTAVLLPGMAPAAEGNATEIGGGLLQLVFGFALILALLFATLWLLKKLSVPRGAAGGMVRVVSAAAVGTRERVVLVDVGEKRLVLGVAPGRVTLLDTQAVPARASGSAENETADMPTFAQRLKQSLTRHHEK